MAKEKMLLDENKSEKKYSKLKKILNGVLDAALIGTSTVFVGAAVSEGVAAVKPLLNEYKNDEQISQDSMLFDANMDLANIHARNVIFKTEFKRLPHNGDKPIYVSIDSKFNEDEVEQINKALEYYEDLFKDINSNYRFEVVSKEKVFIEHTFGNTTITFEKDELPIFAAGLNKQRANLLNSNFLRQNNIIISNNALDYYYTLIHEIGHSFGLADVTRDFTDVDYHNTFYSQTEINKRVSMLYPSDVAILYSMYGQYYRDGNNLLPEKVEIAKQSFEDYKTKFYQKLTDVTLSYFNVENQFIDIQALQSTTLVNQNVFIFDPNISAVSRYIYETQIIDENNASFVIKDCSGNMLYETTTRYEQHEGMIYLPAVHLKNGQYPDKNKEMSPESYKMYAFYKQEDNYYMLDMLNFARANIIQREQTNILENYVENKINQSINLNRYESQLGDYTFIF